MKIRNILNLLQQEVMLPCSNLIHRDNSQRQGCPVILVPSALGKNLLQSSIFGLAVCILISASLFAQQKTDKNLEKTSPLRDLELKQQSFGQFDILSELEPSATTATLYNDQMLEGPVDVNKYIVGPNDIFSLGIWGVLNQALPLNVTPEGSLIIPSVGEIQLAGLTLANAKQSVTQKVKRRFISSDVTLTLISPRRFTVTVTGVGQGTYPTSAILRASTVIAYVLYDSLALLKSGTGKGERTRFSLRNITLTRKNGQTMRIDLLKYFATREEKYNPFLLEGDVINIPKYDFDERFLSVYGAVQFPGLFEYIEGDDLETAIQLVRGFTTMANPDSILISRLDPDGRKMNNFYVNYDENKNMKLQVNDRVMIQKYVQSRFDYKVTILGEVKRLGSYPITLNTTRLADIISEAGLTSNANLATSELYRKLDTFFLTNSKVLKDSTENLFMQRLNDVISNKDEKEQFEIDTKSRIGRVNVDFVKLVSQNDMSQNVILNDGDVIYISPSNGAVYVYGQVLKPGFVPYKDGADYEYYIEKAGGYGDRADESQTRVIKFKTREWLEPDDAKIGANDFIYVPKIIKRDFAYDVDLIAKVASVVASVITLTLLIIQAQK